MKVFKITFWVLQLGCQGNSSLAITSANIKSKKMAVASRLACNSNQNLSSHKLKNLIFSSTAKLCTYLSSSVLDLLVQLNFDDWSYQMHQGHRTYTGLTATLVHRSSMKASTVEFQCAANITRPHSKTTWKAQRVGPVGVGVFQRCKNRCESKKCCKIVQV